jgi:hypothetical protein
MEYIVTLKGNWLRADSKVTLSFETSVDGKKIQMYITNNAYYDDPDHSMMMATGTVYRNGSIINDKEGQAGGHGDKFKAVVVGTTLIVSECTGEFQTGRNGRGDIIAPGGIAGTYEKQTDD